MLERQRFSSLYERYSYVMTMLGYEISRSAAGFSVPVIGVNFPWREIYGRIKNCLEVCFLADKGESVQENHHSASVDSQYF